MHVAVCLLTPVEVRASGRGGVVLVQTAGDQPYALMRREPGTPTMLLAPLNASNLKLNGQSWRVPRKDVLLVDRFRAVDIHLVLVVCVHLSEEKSHSIFFKEIKKTFGRTDTIERAAGISFT